MGAVAALLLVTAVVPLQMASGSPPPDPIAFDAGDLRLHMKTDGSSFKYFDTSGNQVGGTQSFSASAKCAYVAGANGNLLMAPSATITPTNVTGTVVGYLQKDNGYGLGVNRAGKEGTGGCTQTNLTEKLTLELQNDGATSPVKDLYVQSTDLDMEFKYNATLNVAFFLDGAAVGSNTYNCTGSDCGPDSGGGDNYNVHLVPPVNGANPNLLWDKVELTVTSSNSQAAVTLEGGSDAGTSDSIFHLAKLLTPADCVNPIEGDSGDGTHVVIHLLPRGSVCPDKGYTLDVTSRKITFDTSGSGSTSQWVVNVNDWSPEPAPQGGPVPSTTVYPPFPNGESAFWCNGTYSPNAGGTVGASMPAGHSWCLIHQEVSIAGTQMIQVNELYLLEGDAVMCRKCT